MRHDPQIYLLCGIEEIRAFLNGAYIDEDNALKITDLPWPTDYYKREEELEGKVFVVDFDNWHVDFRASKVKIEKDKMMRHRRRADIKKRASNKSLKRLILYLYCKNILFQMAFLYYKYDNELGYKPPHGAYFKVLTILFMRIWAIADC